jgi:hypothetical protein
MPGKLSNLETSVQFFSWDEGACFAPKEIWNSMMLVHWGNTNAKYNYSTTGYFPDNWDHIPIAARGSHVCFDPDKDIVLPAWKVPDADLISAKFWKRYELFVSCLLIIVIYITKK